MITLTTNSIITRATVYNTLGACVYWAEVNDVSAQLNLSELAPGVYFVHAEGDGYLKTAKIVKK